MFLVLAYLCLEPCISDALEIIQESMDAFAATWVGRLVQESEGFLI